MKQQVIRDYDLYVEREMGHLAEHAKEHGGFVRYILLGKDEYKLLRDALNESNIRIKGRLLHFNGATIIIKESGGLEFGMEPKW